MTWTVNVRLAEGDDEATVSVLLSSVTGIDGTSYRPAHVYLERVPVPSGWPIGQEWAAEQAVAALRALYPRLW